jgi:ribonuclease E
MSDTPTGQPVEAPAESPRPAALAPDKANPDTATENKSSDPGPPPAADGPVAQELTAQGGAGGGARDQSSGDGPNRRRRGSRGGRGRGRVGAGPAHGAEEGETEPADAAASIAPAGPTTAAGLAAAPRVAPDRPKIGDSRPARPTGNDTAARTSGGGTTEAGRPDAPSAGRPQGRSGGGGRSRQRAGTGGGSAPADGQASDTGAGATKSGPTGVPTAVRPGSGATPRTEAGPRAEGRRGGRERRGKAVGRYMICVHVRPEMTQIALLEGRTLVEHYISRASDDATQIDGNIYRGRVQNVLPGMEAAFIDIGTPKNAVLYHGDVRYDVDDIESGSTPGQLRIEQMLRPGQTILCQVTKNPIGAKGARLTQEVSLPGRFVVLVPNSTAYGISKRLDDSERKRLRRIVDAIRPQGHGLIVRTAAAGASAEELGNDVERLMAQWETIAVESTKGQGPALLYREPAIAVRVIREELNREYRAVVIDDLALFEQVREYVGAVNPELADRVEYFDPEVEALPVFERYHVHEQLHKALDRKVYLPSGGSLVIDRAEALTVIDVNTGKNVGTTNLEETVYRNNLEAAEEVARQLRLRDIGGIIVIDFIDMEIRENRDKVSSALRSALARDKTRTQVFDISELGLVEMTRKRVSEGLIESMSTTCEVCGGRGIVFDDPEL